MNVIIQDTTDLGRRLFGGSDRGTVNVVRGLCDSWSGLDRMNVISWIPLIPTVTLRRIDRRNAIVVRGLCDSWSGVGCMLFWH